MNQLNALHGNKTTDPPIYWNIQPQAVQFKSRTSPPKSSPVLSAIMDRLNHHAIDNDNFEVHISEYPFESITEYFSDPETTPIK